MKIAPLIGSPGRVLTGTTLKENLTSAEIQVKTLREIEKRFDPDMVFVFMDLTVEAESLGLKIDFPEDKPPTVIESPVRNDTDLDALRRIDLMRGRMPLFMEVARVFKKASTKELGAYVIGPFTLACELMGTEFAAISMMENRDFLNRVMDFTTGVVITYARGLANNGADHVVILEPSSVILSPGQFRKYSFPHVNEISSFINGSVVLHVCGNTTHLFREFRDLPGIDGLSLDSVVNVRDASMVTKKTIIGNINPSIVCYGSKSDIINEIDGVLNSMVGIHDFILSTGCDLPPETPVENILHFMEFARSHADETFHCTPQ